MSNNSPHAFDGRASTGIDSLDDDAVIAACLKRSNGAACCSSADSNSMKGRAKVHRSVSSDQYSPPRKSRIFWSPRSRPSHRLRNTSGHVHWRIDGTTNDIPAKPTMLACRHAAMVGGDTNSPAPYAAYDNLPRTRPQAVRGTAGAARLRGLPASGQPDPTEEQLALWRRLPHHETSLVWDHKDGRRSLVLGATADHIVGVSGQAAGSSTELLAWSTQRRSLTHRWRQGGVVIWDNTGMLRTALRPSSERLMHRTTIAGDGPGVGSDMTGAKNAVSGRKRLGIRAAVVRPAGRGAITSRPST